MDGKHNKTGGRASGSNNNNKESKPPLRSKQQINQVEFDSEDEPFAIPLNFSGEKACEDNIVAVKVKGTTTKMPVDSGAQFTVLGERQVQSLVRSGFKGKLQPEERNLLLVHGNGCLPVAGKFEATIECHGQTVAEIVLVTQGEGQCLLGSSVAKCLQVLKVGPEIANTATVYSVHRKIESIADRFPKVFSGVGKLSGYQLHIDRKVTPIAQKPRRLPYPLNKKVQQKIEDLLDLDIIEKMSGPTTWVSPAVFVSKPNKDEVRICIDMMRANEAI